MLTLPLSSRSPLTYIHINEFVMTFQRCIHAYQQARDVQEAVRHLGVAVDIQPVFSVLHVTSICLERFTRAMKLAELGRQRWDTFAISANVLYANVWARGGPSAAFPTWFYVTCAGAAVAIDLVA